MGGDGLFGGGGGGIFGGGGGRLFDEGHTDDPTIESAPPITAGVSKVLVVAAEVCRRTPVVGKSTSAFNLISTMTPPTTKKNAST
jgi:hypothetical protein